VVTRAFTGTTPAPRLFIHSFHIKGYDPIPQICPPPAPGVADDPAAEEKALTFCAEVLDPISAELVDAAVDWTGRSDVDAVWIRLTADEHKFVSCDAAFLVNQGVLAPHDIDRNVAKQKELFKAVIRPWADDVVIPGTLGVDYPGEIVFKHELATDSMSLVGISWEPHPSQVAGRRQQWLNKLQARRQLIAPMPADPAPIRPVLPGVPTSPNQGEMQFVSLRGEGALDERSKEWLRREQTTLRAIVQSVTAWPEIEGRFYRAHICLLHVKGRGSTVRVSVMGETLRSNPKDEGYFDPSELQDAIAAQWADLCRRGVPEFDHPARVQITLQPDERAMGDAMTRVTWREATMLRDVRLLVGRCYADRPGDNVRDTRLAASPPAVAPAANAAAVASSSPPANAPAPANPPATAPAPANPQPEYADVEHKVTRTSRVTLSVGPVRIAADHFYIAGYGEAPSARPPAPAPTVDNVDEATLNRSLAWCGQHLNDIAAEAVNAALDWADQPELQLSEIQAVWIRLTADGSEDKRSVSCDVAFLSQSQVLTPSEVHPSVELQQTLFKAVYRSWLALVEQGVVGVDYPGEIYFKHNVTGDGVFTMALSGISWAPHTFTEAGRRGPWIAQLKALIAATHGPPGSLTRLANEITATDRPTITAGSLVFKGMVRETLDARTTAFLQRADAIRDIVEDIMAWPATRGRIDILTVTLIHLKGRGATVRVDLSDRSGSLISDPPSAAHVHPHGLQERVARRWADLCRQGAVGVDHPVNVVLAATPKGATSLSEVSTKVEWAEADLGPNLRGFMDRTYATRPGDDVESPAARAAAPAPGVSNGMPNVPISGIDAAIAVDRLLASLAGAPAGANTPANAATNPGANQSSPPLARGPAQAPASPPNAAGRPVANLPARAAGVNRSAPANPASASPPASAPPAPSAGSLSENQIIEIADLYTALAINKVLGTRIPLPADDNGLAQAKAAPNPAATSPAASIAPASPPPASPPPVSSPVSSQPLSGAMANLSLASPPSASPVSSMASPPLTYMASPVSYTGSPSTFTSPGPMAPPSWTGGTLPPFRYQGIGGLILEEPTTSFLARIKADLGAIMAYIIDWPPTLRNIELISLVLAHLPGRGASARVELKDVFGNIITDWGSMQYPNCGPLQLAVAQRWAEVCARGAPGITHPEMLAVTATPKCTQTVNVVSAAACWREAGVELESTVERTYALLPGIPVGPSGPAPPHAPVRASTVPVPAPPPPAPARAPTAPAPTSFTFALPQSPPP
jgi:hypothetical protein